jgi:branched-chain amino acid transport system permease protein
VTQLIQEIINGLVLGSSYALVAIGFNVIYGVVGILNVAQGDIAVAGGYGGLAVLTAAGLVGSGIGSVFLSLAGSLLASGALGLVLYYGVLKRIPQDQMLGMFVATVGVSLVIEYGLARIYGSYPKTYPGLLGTGSFDIDGVLITHAQIVVVAASALLAVLVATALTRTPFGRQMRAVAENSDVARTFGVNVTWVRLVSVVATSMIAGFAGFLLASLYNTVQPFLGQQLAINMFVVSIVGGAASITGAVSISAVIGIATAVTQGYVNANYASMVPLGFLVIFLLIRPQGLFASSQLRRG